MRLTATIFILLLLAGTLLPGCSREDLLDGYNTAIRLAGNLGLSLDMKLEGDREFGVDHYTGTYEAEYEDFTGEEYVFGGTAIERKEGETVTVSCRIEGEKGNARLQWAYGSDDPVVLLDGEGAYEDVIYLTPGSNYFNLLLDGFTGSVELEIR